MSSSMMSMLTSPMPILFNGTILYSTISNLIFNVPSSTCSASVLGGHALSFTHSAYSSASPFHSFYLCLFSNYLLLPLYAIISLYVHSFDVIHSYGYHCFGFKSDCIPGRVNHVSSLQLHFAGHFISYCYELCGLAHTSMLSSINVL